ncbi:L7Ae/L30e/S12e/Gadd45 family ribosomal protein [Macrococcoides caseolyticum]|uniref:L7Ae/L30e/S12e/Gadd45 family ribosomal protein n=1 Tax=Macrococcoides caseolyticum TaxID=69966 RepID=UPI001F40C66C|nr:ribosomal L7Ae/L30e/S12e/Gadd45 family protein [Macrococcus caseolyticus]MCE4956739.1 ribosomal L7Ae/L30e/S12e/Gadd45 family protein [Macrococcus caseolyticus]
MNNHDKLMNLLGLSMRARKLVTGEELVINEVRNKKCKLVILARDAGPNTTKTVTNKCGSFNVPLVQYGTRYELGYALGKSERVTLGIMDAGFAKSIQKLIRDINEERTYE